MIAKEVDKAQAATTELYRDMEESHLVPLWNLEADVMPWTPRPQAIPWLWKWADLYDVAERSGALVPIERGGDRRAIALGNPGLGGAPFATPTLWAAVQWLNGREVAPAHRHTAQAVRFIIDGSGSYSTVDGDRVYLQRGDMVINPPWLWHDHGSDSDERAIWVDGLDIPLNKFLDASFFEPYTKDVQDVTKVENGTVLKYGVGQMRPAWEAPSRDHSPLSTYKWADAEKALMNLAESGEASPFDDIALEYTNPHTGESVMTTISCWIQMLRPAVHTQAHRHVGSSVYFAFEGQGSTIIDGQRFDWDEGDMFVIPSWLWHEHHNRSDSERAILFSFNDLPVMKALDKAREEPFVENGGHQEITALFKVQA